MFVKQYVGNSMVKCFSAANPGRLIKTEGKMNAAKYQEILEDNLMSAK